MAPWWRPNFLFDSLGGTCLRPEARWPWRSNSPRANHNDEVSTGAHTWGSSENSDMLSGDFPGTSGRFQRSQPLRFRISGSASGYAGEDRLVPSAAKAKRRSKGAIKKLLKSAISCACHGGSRLHVGSYQQRALSVAPAGHPHPSSPLLASASYIASSSPLPLF